MATPCERAARAPLSSASSLPSSGLCPLLSLKTTTRPRGEESRSPQPGRARDRAVDEGGERRARFGTTREDRCRHRTRGKRAREVVRMASSSKEDDDALCKMPWVGPRDTRRDRGAGRSLVTSSAPHEGRPAPHGLRQWHGRRPPRKDDAPSPFGRHVLMAARSRGAGRGPRGRGVESAHLDESACGTPSDSAVHPSACRCAAERERETLCTCHAHRVNDSLGIGHGYSCTQLHM